MVKKLLPLFLLPLLLNGCATHFTNLTPQRLDRDPNNLYPVAVAMDSRQQSLRWDSIKPQVVIGSDTYPLRQTLLMTNRWEGLVPVPKGRNSLQYRYKFEYEYNSLGKAKADAALSPEYTLKIVDR
jgi:hypothetical protein